MLFNPANRNRAVPLTFEQFRYGLANVVTEDEAKKLYETFGVPGSGETVACSDFVAPVGSECGV